MTYGRRTARSLFIGGGLALALIGAAPVVGGTETIRTSSWVVVEVSIALTIAVSFGMAASFIGGPRSLPYLNQFASRGLELAAALPTVLACGVVVQSGGVPIPVAVACVIGILSGLRCIRWVAFEEPSRTRWSSRETGRIAWIRALQRSLLPVLPTVLERIVGLEAALAWLELFDHTWSGGWGEHLGQAARRGNLSLLLLWTVFSVGLSVTLKQIAGRISAAVTGSVPDEKPS